MDKLKSVLLSIQPKWCELIANGKKTIDVRKTRPKLEPPFKCYIYCTASDVHSGLIVGGGIASLVHCCNYKGGIPIGGVIGNGKVIGEFVCDKIYEIKNCGSSFLIDNDRALTNRIATASCLDYLDMRNYLCNKNGYGWRISNLTIYDEPKKPSDFIASTPKSKFRAHGDNLTRPPQSWYYVEGLL